MLNSIVRVLKYGWSIALWLYGDDDLAVYAAPNDGRAQPQVDVKDRDEPPANEAIRVEQAMMQSIHDVEPVQRMPDVRIGNVTICATGANSRVRVYSGCVVSSADFFDDPPRQAALQPMYVPAAQQGLVYPLPNLNRSIVDGVVYGMGGRLTVINGRRFGIDERGNTYVDDYCVSGPDSEQKDVESKMVGIPAAKEDTQTDNESERCVVCLSNTKCCTAVPCGHIAFCNGCARQYTANKRVQDCTCPVCRKSIKQIIQVFT